MLSSSVLYALQKPTPTPAAPARRILKILAIGNSFSVDTFCFLYQIARDAGYEAVTLGNLYIGGCSLKQHWENVVGDRPDYRYYKNTDGTWRYAPEKSLFHGLIDEPWDLITLQQASPVSGVDDAYDPYLENLIAFVERYRQNRSAKLAWHMTWAYQKDYDHERFDTYGRDQGRMYRAIVAAVQNKVLPTGKFSALIPSGTAIQNVRAGFVGDRLTRDGFHLDLMLGRYIAGLTCFCALTGEDPERIAFRPDEEAVPPSYMPMIRYAVQKALKAPFEVADMSAFASV